MNFLNLRNLVNESPVSLEGNAPFETLDNRSKSENGIKEDYYKISNFNSYEIYKHNTLDYIILGKWFNTNKKNKFAIIAELSFISYTNKTLFNKFKKSCIEIKTIQVKEANKREGLASYLYKFLSNNYIIVSDKVQYNGAVKLWKNFAKEEDVKVYIYDSIKDIIISKMSNKTPDNYIWSKGDKNDYSKMKIQLLLIKN